eukprot:1169282-Rhodomonas_salina.1
MARCDTSSSCARTASVACLHSPYAISGTDSAHLVLPSFLRDRGARDRRGADAVLGAVFP